MTTPRTILRESALALPFLAALGGLVGGLSGAVEVVAAGIFALLNFGALALAVTAMTSDHARLRGLGIAVLVGKFGIFFGGLALLLVWASPLLVALGTSAVLLGVAVRGVIDAIRPGPVWAEES